MALSPAGAASVACVTSAHARGFHLAATTPGIPLIAFACALKASA
jgi:hypothetical protein